MSKDVFLRKATGLVREFGVLDTIWINLGLVGIIFSLTFISSTGPLTGGNPLYGGILALIGTLLWSLAFSIVGIVTARSAGDYVFTSRYLNPAVGFVGNAGYFVATVPLFMGITIITLESFGLAALFAYMGLYLHNVGYLNIATTLQKPEYSFLVGGTITVLAGITPIFGHRVFRALSRVILPLVLIAVVLMYAVLAFTPQTVAYARLQEIASNNTLISSVNAFGATHNSPPPSISGLANILALNAVYVVGFSYVISAVYVAGEVRQVKRNMPLAILGTLIICFLIFYASLALSYHTFGYNFLSNLYVMAIDYSKSPFPVTPYLDFLAASISGNLYIGIFITLMATLQLAWYQANAVLVGSRLLLSYSLDRILPDAFADVSQRFHVPVKGIITCLIIGLLTAILLLLPSTSAVAFLMSSAAVAIIILFPIAVVGIALIAFRVAKKDEYRGSPLPTTVFGGPLYWIVAGGTVIYALVTFYSYVTTPAIFGFAGTEGLELIFIPIIVLFALFYVSKWINKRRGVPVDLIFKELPPE
ncbi:MAG: amino acid permease [Thermoprotei archaeon]